MSFRRPNRHTIFNVIFFGLVLIFLTIYVLKIDYGSLKDLSLTIPYFLASVVVALMFRYWGVMIWRQILLDLGASREKLPKFRVLAKIYAKAWLARYIPGTITWIASKVYMASRLGISKSRLAISSIVEGGMQIIAIMIVSMILVGFDPRTTVVPTSIKIFLIILSILLAAALYPKIFNKAVGFIYKIIKKKEPGVELTTSNQAIKHSFVMYVAGAFMSGTSAFLLTKSIYPPTEFNQYFFIVGSYCLAGAIGTATPLIPSGIGIREGVQLALFNLIFPPDIALVTTILARIWSVGVDILFYLISMLPFDQITKLFRDY